MKLAHSLQHSVLIRAQRDTVFRYFTDPVRFARWWGEGSHIDCRPGGAVRICYPNQIVATGEVVEVEDGERVVFTYGYEGGLHGVPPGSTRVTVTLETTAEGTRVHLTHDLADAAARDHHRAGWRYQMALFANVVAGEQHAGVAERVDGFLACWSEADSGARRRHLGECVTDDVVFQDAHGCVAGIEVLDAHLTAVQMHMPGMRLERVGDVQQCQGTALVEWSAKGADGQARGRGTNVVRLAPDGRIAGVVGFWRA